MSNRREKRKNIPMNAPNDSLSSNTLRLLQFVSQLPLRRGFVLGALALILACCALPPAARAVTPAPDRGYPDGNTAEGDDALFSLTAGAWNTAIGFSSAP